MVWSLLGPHALLSMWGVSLAVCFNVRLMSVLISCVFMSYFTSSHLHKLEGVKLNVYLACCPGEGSELGVQPEPRVLPHHVSRTRSLEKGWWRVAVKLSMD